MTVDIFSTFPRSYLVRRSDGFVLRRNSHHLRKTQVDFVEPQLLRPGCSRPATSFLYDDFVRMPFANDNQHSSGRASSSVGCGPAMSNNELENYSDNSDNNVCVENDSSAMSNREQVRVTVSQRAVKSKH
uniref:Uncharacterized protein n=1 Tax=Cacopsylla melanoneura TaxID=428564 RepID=A0A8D8X504_9HEMI